MLIAEIGNTHYGDFNKFKEMIRIANECGADLIKGQAFIAEDIRSGSMPTHFYKMCQFKEEQLMELIAYARSIGNDLFFSIFSEGFKKLQAYQKWQKISGAQFRDGKFSLSMDDYWHIVSIPKDCLDGPLPVVRYASVLYVSDYLTNEPDLKNIEVLSERLNVQAGYSDHTIGVDWAIKAHQEYGAEVIEKHFCVQENYSYHGQIFRDSVHSALPKDFEKLANAMGGF